jgi:hypothetical protein
LRPEDDPAGSKRTEIEMKSISNLGKALSIIAKAQVLEAIMHEDVDAFGAPSECHGLVDHGCAKRFRLARRRAEALAGAPLRIIELQARRRGHTLRTNTRLFDTLNFKLNPFL